MERGGFRKKPPDGYFFTFFSGGFGFWGLIECSSGCGGRLVFEGVGEESEVPDSAEAGREDVLGESSDKLLWSEGHGFFLVFVGVVFVRKGDSLITHFENPVVGNGDFMGVTAEVTAFFAPPKGFWA